LQQIFWITLSKEYFFVFQDAKFKTSMPLHVKEQIYGVQDKNEENYEKLVEKGPI
jgi:hypothetical protein